MKAILLLTFLASHVFGFEYAHEGIYQVLALPYLQRCEMRAENAGVSRPNEQILINNCLDTYHIRVARAIYQEYPEYARISGRDPENDEAQREMVKALRMYEDNVLTHPVTGERLSGAAAQKALQIELGRKLDIRNSMQNQPHLMLDQD